jgi:hypothetical protein
MESQKHIYLVELLEKWVRKNRPNSENFMVVDRLSDELQAQPPKIVSRRPDLYLKDSRLGEMIIGEAKTTNDIHTPRTERQLTEFVIYLNQNNGLILLSVDLADKGTTTALIRRIIRRENCSNTRYQIVTPLDV